jgi:hypothetical protein
MNNYEFNRRDLKFRAWDGGEMWQSGEYTSLETFFRLHDDDKIMQWTGLVDKTGRDIYEGDILASTGGHTRLVSFQADKGSFCMAHLNQLNLPWANPWQPMQQEYLNEFKHEVIGNVFENPELIPQ